MALIKCPNCHHDISDTVNQCIHCGTKIVKESIEQKVNTGNKKNKKNKKKYIIVIGVILVIGVFFIFLVPTLNNSKDNYIGKWEHNITWQENGETIRKSYASYELFDDGTFEFNGYTKNDDSDKLNYKGTYNENNGIIYVYFEYENEQYTDTLYIDNGKMCVSSKNCEDYFVKSNSNIDNNIVINETNSKNYITYTDYQDLLSNNESAIVVVVMENCKYCTAYEETIKIVSKNYSTPIYYYQLVENDKINIDAAPTTLLIKNGVVKDTVAGQVEYNFLSERLSNLGFN